MAWEECGGRPLDSTNQFLFFHIKKMWPKDLNDLAQSSSWLVAEEEFAVS